MSKTTTKAAFPLSQPVFETERLRVFRIDYIPSPYGNPKDVYAEPHAHFLGCDMESSNASMCVSATVRIRDKWVEWIETQEGRRRQGLARELFDGLEEYFGMRLYASGCTREGEGFMEAVEQSDGIARWNGQPLATLEA
jgi:hypothetical protein